MTRIVLLALLPLALLLGCGNEKGTKFIGLWSHPTIDAITLTIEKNGESFMVKKTEPNHWGDGEPKTTSYPAKLEGNILQVNIGMGTISLAVDSTSGKLSDGQTDYTKVSN